MKLKLYSVNNRYGFSVGNFVSMNHFYLCPDIKPTYKYAWEAYRDAKNLFRNQLVQVEVLEKEAADDLAVSDIASTHEISAEEMIVSHYTKIFAILSKKATMTQDPKEKELIYKEVKSTVSGLLKIQENLEKNEDKERVDKILGDFRRLVHEKFPKLLAKDKAEMESEKSESKEAPPPSLPPVAPMDASVPPEEMPLTASQANAILKYGSHLNDVRTEVMDEYAERVCKHIATYHPDAFCSIDYDNGIFNVSTSNGKILRVSVNNDLNVESIEPDGELSQIYPLYSLEFYQKYWRPIVEKIGHCLIKDLGIIVCASRSALPDIPNTFPKSVRMNGWHVQDKIEKPFDISFEGENPTWMLKSVNITKEAARKIRPSRYTEDDFIRNQPSRVTCIDPNLKSLYNKVGEVVQVIPLHDHIEVDVNFGRLVVRLTEDQIELVNNEVPPNT